MPASPTPSQAIEPPHWNSLVVTLVGVICTIFLILNYYRFLQRHCCAFQRISFFGHQPQRRPLNEDNLEDPSLQLQSRGLNSYMMHSIPITQFKKKSEEEELGQTNTDCAVCLGEFEEGEWIKSLPNCSHVFHVACIDMWFQTHSSCPLCRSYVDLEVDQEYSVFCVQFVGDSEERRIHPR
ncbi:RING/U-box superfamily protein [Actinidia rufa]|uniref:RING-type E3 ubiquitin transferase n=1 Tax=Actinidia rufa TaxID=165716 RepID=A0A7J0DA06_9ERIC|nr:RING/U-box superfamily protein [Actinidia rufa]